MVCADAITSFGSKARTKTTGTGIRRWKGDLVGRGDRGLHSKEESLKVLKGSILLMRINEREGGRKETESRKKLHRLCNGQRRLEATFCLPRYECSGF